MSKFLWNIQAGFYKALRRNPISARILTAENEAASSLLDRISPVRINRILDIGSGRGNSLGLLQSFQAKIIGLDLTRSMITKARSEYNNVLFLQGDIVHLPVKDNCMDIVICLGVMEYVKYQKIPLLETCRVLRPGGYALISLPIKHRLNYFRRLLGHRIFIPDHDAIITVLQEMNLELLAQQTTLLQNQLLFRKPVVSKTHK